MGVGVFGDGNRGFLLQWVGLGGFLQRCYLGRVFCNSPTGVFCDGAGLPGVFCNSPTGVFCDGAGLPGVFCISPTEVFCISFHVQTRQL